MRFSFSSLFVAIIVVGLSSSCTVYAKSLTSWLTSFQPNARTRIPQLTDRQVIGQCDETTVYAGKGNSLSTPSPNTSYRGNTMQKPFGPPVNSYYEMKMKIPVIGHQIFRLRIKSIFRAELIIEGMLNINDEVPYSVNEVTGEIQFSLSQVTTSILRKFRTKLIRASYCHKTDTPTIEVRPPLPTTIKIRMKRKNSSHETQ
mmetsp:Transcript_15230/g.23194  ORF Transcript_15230/g.23194 Transcript_15230/m.23194 type:complete len:201 (+) Transcript_15230:85-687(+)